MKPLLLFLALVFTSKAGAQVPDTSISIDFIYTFMNEAVKPAYPLKPKYELVATADLSMLINHLENSIDKDSLLMDTLYVEQMDTVHVQRTSGDSTYSYDLYVPHKEFVSRAIDAFSSYDIPQKLDMINQLKRFENYKWDVKRLGMKAKKNKNFYRISPPVFTADRQEAYVCIEDLCEPFLCGTGTIMHFKKTCTTWQSEQVEFWFH